MPRVARRTSTERAEQVARQYLADDGFAADLCGALALARAHPTEVRRIYELISSLPGKPEAEQREIVRAVEALVASTRRPDQESKPYPARP